MELGHKTYHFSKETWMKKELLWICEGGQTYGSMEEGKGGGGKASLVSTLAGLQITDISISLYQPQTQKRRLMDQKTWKCMPRAALILTMQVRSSDIEEQIEYMQDHALIGNFVGMQPSKIIPNLVDQLLLETQGAL